MVLAGLVSRGSFEVLAERDSTPLSLVFSVSSTDPCVLAGATDSCLKRGGCLFLRVDLIEHAIIPDAEDEVFARALRGELFQASLGVPKPSHCLQISAALFGDARPDVKSRLLHVR